ncbi:hypothetical protein RHMOL_Rhmol02G0316300 [Rhododendron molle]|uniref:Uncharacterized protein n=1 Tax=Rhododendron molle TaxID=49168 RepID=A0ACC0PW08_RHOML|nr:hypothetical protein RHMOL_Rhmol02G0316300 [Rhododendron molle]
MRTMKGFESRPLHMAARLGSVAILKQLIAHDCQVDSRTEAGNIPLMIAAKPDQADCFLELIIAGADLGLLNNYRDSAMQLAKRSGFGSLVVSIIRHAILSE